MVPEAVWGGAHINLCGRIRKPFFFYNNFYNIRGNYARLLNPPLVIFGKKVLSSRTFRTFHIFDPVHLHVAYVTPTCERSCFFFPMIAFFVHK